MKSSQFLEEGFVEDAHNVHKDHEVQMAREELYHSAESALRLHKLLRNVSEEHGLEGWVSAKITLANDYLKTVLEYMEYHLMTDASGKGDMSAEPEAEMMPVAEALKFVNPINPEGHTFGSGPIRHDLSNIRKKDEPSRDRPIADIDPDWEEYEKKQLKKRKHQGVAEGSSDTVYPNAQVIKSKNGRPVGEIYQDSDGTWGAFHYRADRGADGMDSREDAIEELRFIHSETGRSGPDYTLKGVSEDTSAGNVATLNNPAPKNKAKAGTLFGGTYQQPKVKAKK